MSTGLLLDAVYKQHITGPGHPERPERYDAIIAGLERHGLVKQLSRITPRRASDDEIAMCHSREYIAKVKHEIASGAHDLSTGDTAIGTRSLDVAVEATGGVLNAVEAVMSGQLRNAFCAVRPPGHHATPTRGMGFCIFNHVAIAARYAQQKFGAERILIADWDVHHGNGTQDIFYEDRSVFFFSTHQSPWYPGTGAASETGEGDGHGATMNCPLPSGSGRSAVIAAFHKNLAPAAKEFRPDMVLISAGFDSRIGDPLGQFTLEDDDFADLTRIMLDIAETHAGGRVVSVLEGGYSLTGLASAVTAHVTTLEHA